MTKNKIQEVIDEEINPALESHGGFLKIFDFDPAKKVLKVLMGGGCHGCASSTETLRNGIQNLLMENFPELSEIQDVTSHEEGKNPYIPMGL